MYSCIFPFFANKNQLFPLRRPYPNSKSMSTVNSNT